MNKRDDGVPAFPTHAIKMLFQNEGMTLWDFFASHALDSMKPWSLDADMKGFDKYRECVAHTAASIADALLAERKKRFGGEG